MASTPITVRLVHDERPSPINRTLDPYLGQDYQTLLQDCLQKKSLFQDPQFPAGSASLGYNQLGPWSPQTIGIQWMRPQEITQLPQFISDSMKWTDICQGQLGNCWFLAAAASLTLYPLLLERVVPAQQNFQNDYAGIFHFQFWQYGRWVDVVVDDYLPTKNGELVFVSSAQKSEFWPALLEKAYAKLNGSYEALNSGWINEAFVDFTGGVDESVDLKAAPPSLFQIIQKAAEKRSLMGASINILDPSESEMRTREGLVKGHAYSIIGVSEVEYHGRKIPLLRLRNPWGQVEWNGRWSDNSSAWLLLDNATRQKLQLKGEDGEFWMQMDDFMRNFDTLDICNLTPDLACSNYAHPWNSNSFEGKWVRGHNAGGCRNYKGTFWTNPQFLVTVEGDDENNACTLLASLLQKDRRKARASGRDFLVIGFEIYKVPEQFGDLSLVSQRAEVISSLIPMALTPYIAKRDITGRYELTPGQYLIIPTTYMPQEESSFNVRVFTETHHTLKEIDCKVIAEAKVFQEGELRMSSEVFNKHFTRLSGQDQEISPEELQSIMVQTTSKHSHLKTDGFSIETCNQLLKIADRSRTGKLQAEEFRYLWSKIKEWEHIFTKHDCDRSGTMDVQELRLALEAAGFQLNNKLVEQLCIKYGDDLRRVDFDSFLSCLAHLVDVFDECRKLDQNKDGVVTLVEGQWMQMSRLQ
ncbi:calpain-1 catalytic subunit-like [Anomaloglossus baeobatrachus]|uniref:calpain-1 catalytic subunit-like n=1 Tax=Anomaloglossus baeobatrachus TaxID=238106 RepID=UPI003F4FC44D